MKENMFVWPLGSEVLVTWQSRIIISQELFMFTYTYFTVCCGFTCMRSSAGASVLAVVPALVDLTSLSSVAGLAATFGHLTGIKEAAPTIPTLNITGPCGGSWGRGIP